MRGKRVLAALVLAVAVPGSPLAQGEGETLLRQVLLDIELHPDWSASVAAIHSEGGRTIAEGLEVRADDGPTIAMRRLTADELRPQPGGGFAAESAMLEGISVSSETGATAIPLIEAGRFAFPGMDRVRFDPEQPFILFASLYSALAEAEVERLAAHEISQTQQVEVEGDRAVSTIHYSDLVLEEWSGGVVQLWSAGPMVVETDTGDDRTRIEMSGAEARRIDIATVAHVFDPAHYRDGRGDRVWRSAVESVRYGPIRIIGEEGALATIGGFGMSGLAMRQADRPFVEAAERMLAEPDMSEAEAAALARAFLPGVLHGFRLGEIWLDDLSLSTPDEVEAGLRRFAITGISADGIDRIGFDGLKVAAADADVSLAAFELAGLVFPELEALFRAAELGGDDEEADTRQMAELAPSLAPRIARMLIDGVSVTAEGVGPITLDSYLVELGDYIGAVPASARSLLTGLTIPGTALNADPQAASVFQGLGIESLTIDFSVDSDYAEAEGRVQSRALLAARDLISVRMEGDLLGLTQDWMTRYTAAGGEGDMAALMPLLAELRLALLTIEVDDQAMVERGFAFAAQQQGREPASYREEISGALPFLLGTFLTDPIFRTDVAAALQSFLEGGRALSVRIAPPTPMSLAEVIAALEADPQSLPGLLGTTVESGE